MTDPELFEFLTCGITDTDSSIGIVIRIRLLTILLNHNIPGIHTASNTDTNINIKLITIPMLMPRIIGRLGNQRLGRL